MVIYDEIIDMVDSFCYLGILINFNGKHYITQKLLAEQSRKAFFALKQKYIGMQLNFATLLHLYDTYVNNVSNNGCSVWG